MTMNYLEMTDADITAHIQANHLAFGMSEPDSTPLTDSGEWRIVRRGYGYAVLHRADGFPGWHLTWLWIDPAHRRQGLARRFMKALLGSYADEFHMSLNCYGPERRKLFGACGFVVEGREGDLRRMTTNKEWRIGL